MRTRRRFLVAAMAGGVAFLGRSLLDRFSGLFRWGEPSWPLSAEPAGQEGASADAVREVLFYERLEDKMARCHTCFKECTVAPGARGDCHVRENRDGTLVSLVYGRPAAVQVDPIEKKPLYHMLPGAQVLSLGTAGCNYRCRHCQNWHLSQANPEDLQTVSLPPEKVVAMASDRKTPGVCFTYNEPTVAYEYMLDTFVLARKKGLRTLLHTNGALQAVSLKKLLEYTDAVCVDLKGFTQKAYQNSAATLEPVLQNLKTIKEQGRWLEVVNLIVPTINDDPADITRMCQWIKENLGVETPLHLSRFFPSYKLTHLPPTPIKVLEQARKIATDAGLHYVIIGNVPGHVSNSTFCPKCGKPLISRVYFEVTKNDLQDGTCRFCGHKVPGIWK